MAPPYTMRAVTSCSAAGGRGPSNHELTPIASRDPEDLQTLRRWSEAPHVLAATDDDWGWEHELKRAPDWREQLIAEADGRAIGFVQLIDPALEDSHYWGDCPTNLRAI